MIHITDEEYEARSINAELNENSLKRIDAELSQSSWFYFC